MLELVRYSKTPATKSILIGAAPNSSIRYGSATIGSSDALTATAPAPYSAFSAGTLAGPASGFSSISTISSEAHAISAAAAPST